MELFESNSELREQYRGEDKRPRASQEIMSTDVARSKSVTFDDQEASSSSRPTKRDSSRTRVEVPIEPRSETISPRSLREREEENVRVS